ncbi:MAG: lipo-like protein [Betaproteobacteria bacterium RIFCSPLOWO2_02_FULL_63_19]|nr:MAG: lipo-like protein [Betaproteobacteria bacterium RIFCSPLOWO2_02_FULL_63_19]
MTVGVAAFAGRLLARFLSRPDPRYEPLATSPPERVAAALRPCDVLLVEGNTRISTAIKYLTQSTWSHAALYLGTGPFAGRLAGEQVLIEADLIEGIRLVTLREYAHMHTRICRPVGLSAQEERRIRDAALARLGDRYDHKNVFDLARYLLPVPPVPSRWRRRMLALGSGEPTRAICSTFLARVFQSVRYPILPRIERRPSGPAECNICYDEIAHIRHYSLFVPRDFDVSPYFRIVKPALEAGFDHHALAWAAELEPAS